MTKWGMPGVYTHAFMDGWSPGYLGSVAYNHNGMMRMYETQSGTEGRSRHHPGSTDGGYGDGGCQRCDGRAVQGSRSERAARGAAAPAVRGTAAAGPTASAEAGAAEGGRGAGGRGARGQAAARKARSGREGTRQAAGPSTGRGGGQPREWYRGIPIPPGAVQNFSRRNNTNYMQTGVLSGLQLTSMIPNLVIENFYRKTVNSIEAGKTEAPYGYVIPPQRDMTRIATLVNLLRVQRIEIGRATAR